MGADQPDPPDAGEPPPRPRRRYSRPGLVGPLFSWELVRLARRGQDARARFILAASLFVVLALFTVLYFPSTNPVELFTGTSQSLSLEQSARFGNYFAVTFLVAQLVILALLTPAYACGGISEEKERKTFPFVLASDLTSREIVFGKVLGRLTFLLGVLFAGLPILSLTQLYGGVSLDFLLASYVLTTSTVVMLGAISAAAAAAVNTYRGALFRAYGLTALHIVVGCVHPFASPPVVVAVYLSNLAGSPYIWYVTGAYSSAQLLVAALSVWLAVRWVRKLRATPGRPLRPPRRDRPELTPVVVRDADPAAGDALPVARRVAPRRPTGPPEPRPPTRTPYVPEVIKNRPRIGSTDPFVWKETHTTGLKRTADDESMRSVVLAVGIAVGVVVGFIAVIGVLSAVLGSGRSNTPVGLVILPAVGCLALYLLQVGSASAGAIVRERQRMTLESLLTIPVDRRRILAPKWQACALKAWVWALPPVVLLPIGFALTDAPLVAVPAALLTPAAAVCVVSFGLWLSVRCDTLTRATLWLMVLVGVIAAAPLAVWAAVSPAAHLYCVLAASAAVAVLAAAGWLFWARADREFEAVGRA